MGEFRLQRDRGSDAVVAHLFLHDSGGRGATAVMGAAGAMADQPLVTTTIALFYAIYPGFLGQPISQTFHSHYFALAMGIFSLGITIRAQYSRNPRTYAIYTLIAMLSGAICLFMFEIYVSFELLRLLLIGYIGWRQKQKSGRELTGYVVRRWLPYLAVILMFVFWRVSIFKSTRPITDLGFLTSQYLTDPVSQLIRIPSDWARNFLEVSVLAWFAPAQIRADQAYERTFLIPTILGGGAAIVVIVYGRWTQGKPLHLTNPSTGAARGGGMCC